MPTDGLLKAKVSCKKKHLLQFFLEIFIFISCASGKKKAILPCYVFVPLLVWEGTELAHLFWKVEWAKVKQLKQQYNNILLQGDVLFEMCLTRSVCMSLQKENERFSHAPLSNPPRPHTPAPSQLQCVVFPGNTSQKNDIIMDCNSRIKIDLKTEFRFSRSRVVYSTDQIHWFVVRNAPRDWQTASSRLLQRRRWLSGTGRNVLRNARSDPVTHTHTRPVLFTISRVRSPVLFLESPHWLCASRCLALWLAERLALRKRFKPAAADRKLQHPTTEPRSVASRDW